jgi:hypothetical protein
MWKLRSPADCFVMRDFSSRYLWWNRGGERGGAVHQHPVRQHKPFSPLPPPQAPRGLQGVNAGRYVRHDGCARQHARVSELSLHQLPKPRRIVVAGGLRIAWSHQSSGTQKCDGMHAPKCTPMGLDRLQVSVSRSSARTQRGSMGLVHPKHGDVCKMCGRSDGVRTPREGGGSR